GYFVQAEHLDATAVLAAAAALVFSLAQRSLSTPARALRRRVEHLSGEVTVRDGPDAVVHELTVPILLAPLERALSLLSWAMVILALALLAAACSSARRSREAGGETRRRWRRSPGRAPTEGADERTSPRRASVVASFRSSTTR